MRNQHFPPTLKRLGQHFLVDQKILHKIADALNIGPDDTVIEIGPGRGALTDILASRARKVVAVELDHELVKILRARYTELSTGLTNVEIVESDILQVSLSSLVNGPYVLAGNVPYYITTPILFHVLQDEIPPTSVFMVQHEVAARAVAEPGTRIYGALSVNLQTVARVEYLFMVPPTSFRPPPAVDSAVIRLTPLEQSLIKKEDLKPFQRFVQSAFGLRRKQLGRVIRNLSYLSGPLTADQAVSILDSVNLDPTARPETLAPQDFVTLFNALRSRAE